MVSTEENEYHGQKKYTRNLNKFSIIKPENDDYQRKWNDDDDDDDDDDDNDDNDMVEQMLISSRI